MLKLPALALMLFAGFPAATAAAQSATAPGPQSGGDARVAIRHVVELFTSQGCSSCPPADALLTKLASRSDIIALTLAVDYWDYLGWKDTLGSPKNSKRQRKYATARGDGMVYTPQMVIDGRVHVNGTKVGDVESALKKTIAALKATHIPVEITTDQGLLIIEAAGAPNGQPAKECTLWLAMVQRQADVPIRSGENKGQTLTYTNVVRDLMPLGAWIGKPVSVRLDTRSLPLNGANSYVAVLQDDVVGPVVGVSQLVTFSPPDSSSVATEPKN